MNFLLLLYGCIYLITYQVDGHKSGAPATVCNSMTPKHGAEPQTSQAPYSLTVKPQNGQFEVTLKTTQPGDFFRGFFIQVREKDNPNNIINGEFSSTVNAKFVECNGGEKNAITHDSNSDKTGITSIWTPKGDYTGDAIIRATVVRTGQKFWINFDSKPFHVSQTQIDGTQKPTSSAIQLLYEKCGMERGCFGLPENCIENNNCVILLAYFYDINKALIEFEIIRKIGSNFEGWISAGISDDKSMGSDSVADCILANGKPSFHYSWNEGQSNQILDKISEIQALSASAEDGLLNCKWTRETKTTEKGITFDLLNNEYYILLARGQMQSPLVKQYHDDRIVSGSSVNFTSISIIGGGSNTQVLVKAHGSLMVIAWAGFVSIAILLAKHYKDSWNEKTLCNVKIWFAFHRGLMVTSVLMIISAFIIIFVHVGKWSSNANTHAILGCIATGFAVLQPIGALFRPDPTDSNRPIFNWLHWTGGNAGQIISFVTIFLTIDLRAASLPKTFFWVFAIFLIYHALFHILMQIYVWQLQRRKKNEINMIELSGGKEPENNVLGLTFKQKLLVIYVLPVSGLIITLVVIICIQ